MQKILLGFITLLLAGNASAGVGHFALGYVIGQGTAQTVQSNETQIESPATSIVCQSWQLSSDQAHCYIRENLWMTFQEYISYVEGIPYGKIKITKVTRVIDNGEIRYVIIDYDVIRD